MPTPRHASVIAVFAALALVSILAARAGPVNAPPGPNAAAFRILVFSRTAGFRHDCIPAGIDLFSRLGARHGFNVDATEDPADFTSGNLARYAAVVFLCTTGDVLGRAQELAFEGYIRAGGGFVGIHSAADTEYGWPFYGQLVGAYFAGHPEPQVARILLATRAHPSTAMLPDPWTRFDEWYNFQAPPGPGVRILARLDESSYTGGTMGANHPITWCRDDLGGRSWYTGGGHTIASYTEPPFEQHIWGGLRWAARVAPRPAGPARAVEAVPRRADPPQAAGG